MDHIAFDGKLYTKDGSGSIYIYIWFYWCLGLGSICRDLLLHSSSSCVCLIACLRFMLLFM